MFYDIPKGYDGSIFNILLYIEDVLPSRLKILFETKKEIDNIEIFKSCLINKKENKFLKFNFGILRTFFYNIDKKNYDKYFLEIVNKIFSNKIIDYDLIIKYIINKIRYEFINNKSTKIVTIKGFMLLNYVDKLNLFNNKNVIKMNGNNIFKINDKSEEIEDIINKFFKTFKNFFDNDIKKAIFLEGVLTQFLLNIQFKEKNSTPFRAKLKGLKLDEKNIKKLLPEIQNKLEEYKKNYYKDLETIISKYFILSDNKWNLTCDEINFYFVLGMNLSYLFKKDKGDNNE